MKIIFIISVLLSFLYSNEMQTSKNYKKLYKAQLLHINDLQTKNKSLVLKTKKLEKMVKNQDNLLKTKIF